MAFVMQVFEKGLSIRFEFSLSCSFDPLYKFKLIFMRINILFINY